MGVKAPQPAPNRLPQVPKREGDRMESYNGPAVGPKPEPPPPPPPKKNNHPPEHQCSLKQTVKEQRIPAGINGTSRPVRWPGGSLKKKD